MALGRPGPYTPHLLILPAKPLASCLTGACGGQWDSHLLSWDPRSSRVARVYTDHFKLSIAPPCPQNRLSIKTIFFFFSGSQK